MVCPNCGAVHSLADQFCRHCGWHFHDDKATSNKPVIIEPQQALVSLNTKQAVALGSAATVTAGAIAWLAVRWLARRAMPLVMNKLPQLLLRRKPASSQQAVVQSIPPEEAEVQVESYYFVRRIRLRR